MAFKFVVLALFVAAANASGYAGGDYTSFSYGVSDPHTGDVKSQQESRSGGNVVGQYSLLESDGTRRTVDYAANPHTGFNAVVRKDPAYIGAAYKGAPAAYIGAAYNAAPAAYVAPAAVASPLAYSGYGNSLAYGAYGSYAAPAAYGAYAAAPVAYSSEYRSIAPSAYGYGAPAYGAYGGYGYGARGYGY